MTMIEDADNSTQKPRRREFRCATQPREVGVASTAFLLPSGQRFDGSQRGATVARHEHIQEPQMSGQANGT